MSLRRFSKLVSCMSSNFLLMGVICLVLVYYQGKDLLETCSSIYKLQKNGLHQAKSFLVTSGYIFQTYSSEDEKMCNF